MTAVKKLRIYFETDLIGVFSQDSEMTHSFAYDESWLKNKEAFALSLSMPLQKAAFGNKTTLAFFENLLPEGDVRGILEKWHHSKGVFKTLSKYGEDCAGALVITPNNKPPSFDGPTDKIELGLHEIYESLIENKSSVDLIADKNPGYLSIAGAQDKFPCIFEDGKIYLPTSGAPTTHILKTPILMKGIKESVYNEYFCMRLAKEVGLDVPDVTVIDGKHPLFLIERFDRERDANLKSVVKRIHQEDFCQAQGLLSSEKYEHDGGPSFSQNYQLMLSAVSPKKRIRDSFRMIDWLCFNLLIGNNDSHSKNISFLLRQRSYELSPFYDLISTAIYPKLDTKFSFKIGNTYNFNQMGPKAVALEEEKLGIKSGTIGQRMKIVHNAIIEKQELVLEEIDSRFPASKIHKRIATLIQKRASSFRKIGLE